MTQSKTNSEAAPMTADAVVRPEPGARLPELDGLRGIAILMVFLLHYVGNSQNNTGQLGTPLYRFAQMFRLCWSGVDLFFVLSGFLIGGILMDTHDRPGYFRTFYLRRVFRILPVYYAWVTIVAIVSFVGARWIAPQNPTAYAISFPLVIYYLFLQNSVFLPTSLFTHYGLSVTWSLAVEEQFYLIAPWIIRHISIRRLTQLLLACIAGAPILRAILYSSLPHGPDVIYVLMPCRADTLAMGMLAAVAWRTDARARLAKLVPQIKIALGILVFGAILMVKWLPGPRNAFQAAYQYSWLGVMYTCAMLIVLLDRENILARITRSGFLREWGRVSYCVYLIHLGILGACSWIFLHSLPRIYDWRGVGVVALAAAISWGLAQLSWKYFEGPLIERGHAITRRPETHPYSLVERISEHPPGQRTFDANT
jgi:peptidoglycan/LPS O-acetylase OafA/YrhL